MLLLVVQVDRIKRVSFKAESSVEFLVVIEPCVIVTDQEHPDADVELTSLD